MKLVYSNFNKETGVSMVILQNKNGRYIGTARLHPDDKGSEISGCSLAEKRAWIDYYKSELKRNKTQLKETLRIKNDIILNDLYEGCSEWAIERIDTRIRYLIHEQESLKNELMRVKEHIKKSIEIRDALLKKVGQK